ncbi:protein ELC-like [Durio zibethinus]|uniref:Protein ELC-like n=1 Tax=Durio zibethinus TaxID=66656 RepID=A0A6P6ALI7_DURZI|nr:protein ELC-like [Durio zibethinus]XP_022765692.1 protein ELC-like [Durio zibethinus]XP_022765693.1 protein ELC-like [Durio zibethinus]
MVPTPSIPPPNPQQIQQFLSSVLSQRGPSSLPYTEDTKWLIRQHLLSLISHCPSLEPKTATFTHNDGRSVNLLQVDGTIPMAYQGVTYNIPIIIWLMESYPRYPPVVYVNPTRDMVIKRHHPHVTPSGLVSIPYLQNWIYPSSNLVDLVVNLSSVFSRDPPLYSQRRPSPNPNPNLSPNPSINSSMNSSYGQSHPPPRVAAAASGYPPSPYGRVQPPYPPPSQTEDAAEVYKRNAVNKLVEVVHGDISGMRKAREVEMEGLFSAQAVLRRREEEINKGLKEMQDEKEGLEQQLQVVLMNTDVLDSWVRDNEGKTKNLGESNVDVDEAFHCVDVLSKQMLDCTAADLAIEDVVYSLDKAVQEGAVPFDQYLRNVRLLSREQFFHKATAAKVRAAQMQAQIASMAARAPHYVT